MEKTGWRTMLIKMIHGSLRRVRDQISGYLSNICREILRATRHDKQWNFFSPPPINNRPSNSDKILLPRNTNRYNLVSLSKFSNEDMRFLYYFSFTFLNCNKFTLFESKLIKKKIINRQSITINPSRGKFPENHHRSLRPSTSFDYGYVDVT